MMNDDYGYLECGAGYVEIGAGYPDSRLGSPRDYDSDIYAVTDEVFNPIMGGSWELEQDGEGGGTNLLIEAIASTFY